MKLIYLENKEIEIDPMITEIKRWCRSNYFRFFQLRSVNLIFLDILKFINCVSIFYNVMLNNYII